MQERHCICFEMLHSSSVLTGSRFRPGEVTAQIDETAESRENADFACWREIDNIDRGVKCISPRSIMKMEKVARLRNSC